MVRFAALGLVAVGVAIAQSDAGRSEYELRCARCHGADASGGEGGSNVQAQIAARSADELAAVLRVGRQFPTNQVWKASPMTYEFDHRQYIAVAAGSGIMAFALPD